MQASEAAEEGEAVGKEEVREAAVQAVGKEGQKQGFDSNETLMAILLILRAT